jgi:N utilization substance protein A
VIIVDDENLAQAIGKGGQDVELAGRLVDRKLDVHGEQEWSQMDEESKNKILMSNYEDERRMRAKRADEDRKAKAAAGKDVNA